MAESTHAANAPIHQPMIHLQISSTSARPGGHKDRRPWPPGPAPGPRAVYLREHRRASAEGRDFTWTRDGPAAWPPDQCENRQAGHAGSGQLSGEGVVQLS